MSIIILESRYKSLIQAHYLKERRTRIQLAYLILDNLKINWSIKNVLSSMLMI